MRSPACGPWFFEISNKWECESRPVDFIKIWYILPFSLFDVCAGNNKLKPTTNKNNKIFVKSQKSLLHTLPPPPSPDTAPSLSFSRDATVVSSPPLVPILLRSSNIIINSRNSFLFLILDSLNFYGLLFKGLKWYNFCWIKLKLKEEKKRLGTLSPKIFC